MKLKLRIEIYFGELTPGRVDTQDVFDPIKHDEYYGEMYKDHISLMRNK